MWEDQINIMVGKSIVCMLIQFVLCRVDDTIEYPVSRCLEMTAVFDKRRICTGLASIQKTVRAIQKCFYCLNVKKKFVFLLIFVNNLH